MSSGTSTGRQAKSGYKVRQLSNYTPEQHKLFQSMISKLTGGGGVEGGIDFLSKLAGGDEEAFGQMEKPAYSAFQGLLGQIGSRFAGSGALGSSAFQNATSGAAANLAENLQSKRLGIQQGAIERLLGLSQNVLGQRPYENQLEEEGGFDWGSLLGGAAGAIGGPIGGGLGKALLPKLLKLLGLG